MLPAIVGGLNITYGAIVGAAIIVPIRQWLLAGGVGDSVSLQWILYGIALYSVLRNPQYETVPTGQRTTDTTTPTDTRDDSDRRHFLYPMIVVYLYFISSMLSTRTLSVFLPAFIVAVYAYSVTLFDLTLGAESVANIYFSLLLVSGAVMQLLLGNVTDKYDSRKILLGCMALATIGMVTLAIVDLHPLLLIGVIIVLGTGLYGVNPARDALISDLSPSEYEGRTFGYIFTAVTLTGTPLPTIIGYLLEEIGMRGGFLLLAIGPVAAALCITLLFSDRVYLENPQLDATGRTAD
jgi:MFS family permease